MQKKFKNLIKNKKMDNRSLGTSYLQNYTELMKKAKLLSKYNVFFSLILELFQNMQ